MPDTGLSFPTRLSMGTLLGGTLAKRGLSRGSLSESGALSAFLVGATSFACSPSLGGVLLTFYYAGNYATKFKAEEKAKFDLETEKSRRSAAQVLCTAGVGSLASLYLLLKTNGLSAGIDLDVSNAAAGSRTFAVLAYLGSFACACGDTLASELGMLSTANPILITTLEPVPRGTNGGISTIGLACSAAGGAVIGLSASFLALAGRLLGFERGAKNALLAIPICTAAGLFGSLVDSVLGATMQRTWLQLSTLKTTSALPKGAHVLFRKYSPELLEPRESAPRETDERSFITICGKPFLSNEAVNLVSEAVTAIVTGYVGLWLLGRL